MVKSQEFKTEVIHVNIELKKNLIHSVIHVYGHILLQYNLQSKSSVCDQH